jgi:hypothetical protein
MPPFLRFTDREGRRWRAYEFSIIAGRVLYTAPGARASQYRGFKCDESGPVRRRYMLFKPEERRVDIETLQLQLALSDVDPRDDPTHPVYGRKAREEP